MLYTPVPGTPLHDQMQREGRLVDGDLADIHGQLKFTFRYAATSREQSKEFLDRAFQRDFEHNGPSLFRVCKTTLQGWMGYKNHPDARIRRRFRKEAKALKWSYSGLLWAIERVLRPTNERVADLIRRLRDEVRREFGLVSILPEWSLGPLMLATARREARRLAEGVTYEPKTIVERTNWVIDELHNRFSPGQCSDSDSFPQFQPGMLLPGCDERQSKDAYPGGPTFGRGRCSGPPALCSRGGGAFGFFSSSSSGSTRATPRRISSAIAAAARISTTS